jgi:5'-3' exonuclease
MKFVLVDLSNLFARCRHVSNDDDIETKAAIAVSLVFQSLKKLNRNFDIDHIVFAIDSGSWRSLVYPHYKAKRKFDRLERTPEEQEEDKVFYSYLNKLIEYLDKKTKCTVLRAYNVEGDDFIARFIQNHPDDDHMIVSGDSDFVQLLADNVKIYDGINDRLITTAGVTDHKGLSLEFKIDSSSGKIKILKTNADFVPEQEWWRKALFVKLLRGDSGDGIFSAYPGISYKGTSKRIGIMQAWEDRHLKEYHWNNFFLQEWKKAVGIDDNGEVIKENVRVIDEYRINESLIDLTKQPDDIKVLMDKSIKDATKKDIPSRNIGFDFNKFCKSLDLPGLMEEADQFIKFLNKPYRDIHV